MYFIMKKKPNSKIIYSPDSYMVTPAEYIQIIAAGIYGAALFFTILTFQRSKRLDQISLATEVMHELRDLDRELAKIPSESQNDDVKGGVYSRMLNTVDWLSFLVNEKMVTDKRLVARMKPIVVRYYEDLVQNNVRLDEKKVIAYEDLEKLYRKIKKLLLLISLSICIGTARTNKSRGTTSSYTCYYRKYSCYTFVLNGNVIFHFRIADPKVASNSHNLFVPLEVN